MDDMLTPAEAPEKTAGQLEAEAAEQRAAAILAAAKKAHDEAIAVLQPAFDEARQKLDQLKADLAASLEKARTDAGHLDYAASFVRHAGLIADEASAWIKRHV
jgi:hypothetical protein